MKTRYIFIASCICLFVFPVILVAQDYYIQWADTVDIGDYDCAHGVAVDNANNIIVTGNCGTTGVNYDYLTVKYDSNGIILWQDILNIGIADIARGVAVDNSNNIIVTGQCIITGDPYSHYLTVKYDPNGTILWADTIVNGRHDTGLGVATDNSNNIIVTGYCVMEGPNCDYFTVKYDPGGTILWQDTIDNRTYDYAHGVAVDNSNNIIVTGEAKIGDDCDYFTVKYDPNGTILWQDTIDNGDDDWAHAVAVDNSNNIIVTGVSDIGGDDNDCFTVKYVPTSGISEDEDCDIIHYPNLQNIYPNPFNTRVEIKLSLDPEVLGTEGQISDNRSQMTEGRKHMSLKIYDLTGRLVKNFPISNFQFPICLSWDGRNNAGEKVTSGVYFLRLETEDYRETGRLLLIK